MNLQLFASNTHTLTHNLTNLDAENISIKIQPDEGYTYPLITSADVTPPEAFVSYDYLVTHTLVVTSAATAIYIECPLVESGGSND